MARYLERLVARAGIANDAVPAAPVPRPQYDPQAGDPFENTAVWEAESATPQVVQTVVLPAPPVAEPRVETAPGQIMMTDLRTSEVRVEEHWLPSVETAPVVMPVTVEPAVALRETVREIEWRPAPQMPEREIRTEATLTEATLERETIRTETLRPAPAPLEPALNPGDIERSVLEKLMPALDAWFKSDAPAFSAEAAPALPMAPSRQHENEAVVSAATEAPQLVIGSIRVEVTAPPAAVAPSFPRRPVGRAAPAVSRPSPSRLGIGLGQI
ncbi:MAG: hypothetical protein ABJC09_01590 [Terriglobia bacterium]